MFLSTTLYCLTGMQGYFLYLLQKFSYRLNDTVNVKCLAERMAPSKCLIHSAIVIITFLVVWYLQDTSNGKGQSHKQKKAEKMPLVAFRRVALGLRQEPSQGRYLMKHSRATATGRLKWQPPGDPQPQADALV